MVQTIIRHLYVCEICGVEYERFHLAVKCENSHNDENQNHSVMTKEQLLNLIQGKNLRE